MMKYEEYVAENFDIFEILAKIIDLLFKQNVYI